MQYSVWLLGLEIYFDKSSDCGRAGDSEVLMTVCGYLIVFPSLPLLPPLTILGRAELSPVPSRPCDWLGWPGMAVRSVNTSSEIHSMSIINQQGADRMFNKKTKCPLKYFQ